MDSSELSEHARLNQIAWTTSAPEYVDAAERAWSSDEPYWGIWGVPESEVHALDGIDPAGADVVELGCGTAYWSAWFARWGASPVGIDVTEAQLETARRLQAEHDLAFPLIQASAEDVPLPDESFDLAFSEYGASIWCDPYAWIPEAARLLRSDGRLVFLLNGAILMLFATTSGCIGSTGPTTTRPWSSSTSGTATGFASSGRAGSRWRTSSRCDPRRARRRATRS